ncbi:MAG TPA: DUF4382 domain-containing protein [Balneolaceae bacterium]
MFYKKLLSIVCMLAVVLFAGCSGTGTNGSMGTLTVEMTDAPIDSADAVNVVIERVEVNNEEDSKGWIVINEPNKTYNLLKLVNGATTVLGSATLEPGTYSQIRLILAQEGHSVVIDGEEYAMMVPSGAQTGVKLNINAEIKPDVEYTILLDFDASRSVVATGRNNPTIKYLLKPVIKATNKAITGSIAGTVSPVEALPVVYAIADSDTLASTIADTSSGDFKLIGLEEGSYTVSIDPRNDAYQPESVDGVQVTVDETNDIGTVELSQN